MTTSSVLERRLSADLHHVIDRVDHAAHFRRVLQLDRVVHPAQTEAAHGGDVILFRTDRALDQRDSHCLFIGHDHAPKICSTVRPRLAAISYAVFCSTKEISVARTRLYGFVEPWHLARTFVTPTTSQTARIGPPAMMPVPSAAGCMKTLVAPCRPSTAWCSVPFLR